MSGSAKSLLSKPTLKLVIDTKASKVLFAEAEKGFVDFILGILALPVGALMRLIEEKEDLVCSLGALYSSVDELNAAFMKTPSAKSLLLQRDAVIKCYPSVPFLRCEGTRALINKQLSTACDVGDFVLGPITCMVMDDLSVQPLSIARVFDVTSPVIDADRIKEITVPVGQDEALKILKAALNSKNVLTDVFFKFSQDAHK